MTNFLFDTHCHLDFSAFADDRTQVIEAAQQQGVKGFVVPGVMRQQWPKLIQLHQQFKTCAIGFGLHPYFIEQHVPADLLHLESLLTQYPHACVGEVGLDAHCPQPAFQRRLLRSQLLLAQEKQRPVILHHRKTLGLLLNEVKRVRQGGSLFGVVHAFSGSPEQAKEWADLGFKLGVGGVITYARAKKTRRAIASAPLSSLVLETDSPDMPLAGYQGLRNEPLRIKEVFTTLCELRPESPESISKQLLLNTKQLFPNISI